MLQKGLKIGASFCDKIHKTSELPGAPPPGPHAVKRSVRFSHYALFCHCSSPSTSKNVPRALQQRHITPPTSPLQKKMSWGAACYFAWQAGLGHSKFHNTLHTEDQSLPEKHGHHMSTLLHPPFWDSHWYW